MSPSDEKRLVIEVEQTLKDNGIKPMLDCRVCGRELTLRMEVGPEEKPKLFRIAYNCQYCLAMNVVWPLAPLS